MPLEGAQKIRDKELSGASVLPCLADVIDWASALKSRVSIQSNHVKIRPPSRVLRLGSDHNDATVRSDAMPCHRAGKSGQNQALALHLFSSKQ